MFLSLLSDNQKETFFSLAYNVAMSDNVYSAEEQEVMDSYALEMRMQFDVESANTNITEVIEKLNELCDNRVKKIIIFEIIGLAMADTKYDSGERKIVSDMHRIFGIESSFGDKCESKINEYLKIQEGLNKLVLS